MSRLAGRARLAAGARGPRCPGSGLGFEASAGTPRPGPWRLGPAHSLAGTPGRRRQRCATRALVLARSRSRAMLHVDPARLRSVWAQSRQQASTGGFSTTQERIAWVAAQLDCRVANSVLDDLAKTTDDVWRLNVSLYSDTRTVLTELKARGLKLGILSNGPRAMVVLKDSLAISDLLDFFFVSCETGVLKPDPESYRIAIETMGLLPEQIAYVGDGNDHELNGARDASLYAVRVRRSAAAYADPKNQSTFWNAEITQLAELLTLVTTPAPMKEPAATGQ